MGALFKKVMKSGLLITAGFLTHRLLTSLVVNYLVPLLKPAPAPATTGQFSLATFEKPLAGLGVLAVGVPIANVAAKGVALQLGAGMVVSWGQSLLVSILQALEQPRIAAQFEGYSNSRAYSLRGNRGRRAVRGLGQAGRRTSIMPRYQQVGQGQYRQAAAGMGQYRQAAAGWLGEYFTPNSVGEYFAPNSVQGVGQYEPAGPLAMQASAGTGQVIDDGIRPDSNLDAVMDLAESAAGLRGGVGEYYTATRDNSGYAEQRVPTQSQWIPSGPLWAGTLGVRDTQAQADLPAGILAGPGGNGVLSG
jgi:hypothetical protein